MCTIFITAFSFNYTCEKQINVHYIDAADMIAIPIHGPHGGV